MNLRSTLTTSALAAAGVGLTWFAGGKLQEEGRFSFKPNPLGLKASPYGQVIAMAIQAPIDADWHGGIEIHNMPVRKGEEKDHDHEVCEHDHSECEHDHEESAHDHGDCDHEGCDHDEAEIAEHDSGTCSDPDCDHDHGATAPSSLIDRLAKAVGSRTNPNPPTPAHKYYLRREIEKKLRFAYELDPSHYANYSIYHLFLTQRELGTSSDSDKINRENAKKLAQITINYCLRETEDPRPALTAASAAYNLLEMMFIEEEKATTAEMRKQLAILDFCLQRHFEMLEKSTINGNWNLLSEVRQSEVLERSRFTLRLREAAEQTIVRLETPVSSTANHDPS